MGVTNQKQSKQEQIEVGQLNLKGIEKRIQGESEIEERKMSLQM